MRIVNAECMALDIPFYADYVTRHMHRANTHSERVHVYRLEADNGLVVEATAAMPLPADTWRS